MKQKKVWSSHQRKNAEEGQDASKVWALESVRAMCLQWRAQWVCKPGRQLHSHSNPCLFVEKNQVVARLGASSVDMSRPMSLPGSSIFFPTEADDAPRKQGIDAHSQNCAHHPSIRRVMPCPFTTAVRSKGSPPQPLPNHPPQPPPPRSMRSIRHTTKPPRRRP